MLVLVLLLLLAPFAVAVGTAAVCAGNDGAVAVPRLSIKNEIMFIELVT